MQSNIKYKWTILISRVQARNVIITLLPGAEIPFSVFDIKYCHLRLENISWLKIFTRDDDMIHFVNVSALNFKSSIPTIINILWHSGYLSQNLPRKNSHTLLRSRTKCTEYQTAHSKSTLPEGDELYESLDRKFDTVVNPSSQEY